MNVTISSLFIEPGCYFSISYKVDLLIENKLNQMIIIPYGIDKINPKTYLSFIVSTNSQLQHVEVKGPDYNKKDKFINWGLWLPYKEIVNVSNQIKPYLMYFFDAAIQVLKEYGVNETDVRKVQIEVEKEVINNSEYIYEEDETPEIDLSDLNI